MKKLTLMDGASGTTLWAMAGEHIPVWRFNMEKPEIVSKLAETYLDAGAELILGNTFAVNSMSLKGTDYTVPEVVRRGIAIAREAVAGRAKIALSMGPLPVLLEPYGDLTEDEVTAEYEAIMRAGVEAGADILYIETFMDVEMAKLALAVARTFDLPVFCSFSFEGKGRTMMGNSVSDILRGVEPYHVDAVGLNCSQGPDQALPVIRAFAEQTNLPLIFKPNAGKPSPDGGVEFDAETFVDDVLPALDCGISYLGGCCGTSPAYIRRLHDRLKAMGKL